MKIAYYSPLPPERTGIADYSALLLPELVKRIDVEIALRGSRPPRADLSVYHVGNSPEAHGWIVAALRRNPGLVVLHEFVLQHLVAGMTLAQGDVDGYLDAMQRDAGVPGRLLAFGVATGRVPPPWHDKPELFPLSGTILDLAEAYGLVVHSRYVERRAREAGFEGPVWRVPHPAWPIDRMKAADVEGNPVVGTFGVLNPWKRIPELLAAFAALRTTHPQARLLLVGQQAGLDVRALVEQAGLKESVVHTGHVAEEDLWSFIAACDICVSLRWPTMGATSGVALRALSLGKPLIVSGAESFVEFPDDVAIHISVGGSEIDDLTQALRRLADSPEERAIRGQAARAYVESEHDLGRVADAYVAAFEESLGGPMIREELLARVAEGAAEVGIADMARFGAAFREVMGVR